MKRAAVDHPKLQRLQRRLGLNRFEAMGLLEALWHFTGRYAPQGDLGRWSDEEIASWIEWTEDPEQLIENLVLCGWVDRDPVHRLLVHDWADHADEATKVSLKRAGKSFAVASIQPALPNCRNAVATVSSPPEPCQSHAMPEPCPEPDTGRGTQRPVSEPGPDGQGALPGGYYERAQRLCNETGRLFRLFGPVGPALLEELLWLIAGYLEHQPELDCADPRLWDFAERDARENARTRRRSGTVSVRGFCIGFRKAVDTLLDASPNAAPDPEDTTPAPKPRLNPVERRGCATVLQRGLLEQDPEELERGATQLRSLCAAARMTRRQAEAEVHAVVEDLLYHVREHVEPVDPDRAQQIRSLADQFRRGAHAHV